MSKLTITLLFLVLAVPSAFATQLSGIAAVVNEEVITTMELDREMAQVLRQTGRKEPTGAEAANFRKTTLDMMVDKKLVQQRIREMGITIRDEELNQSIEELKRQSRMTQEALVAALKEQGMTFDQYRAKIREQLEVLRVMSLEVNAKAQASEREMREYYEANPMLFADPPRYRARHIFFRIQPKASNLEIKSVMAKASSVLTEATEGKDFTALAKKYSDDPKAASDNGSMIEFRKGEMLPEIEQAVLSMQPGEVSELISTPSGVHLIKLEEIVTPGPKPFTEVKGQVVEAMQKKKSEERFRQWMADLRKNANIEIKTAEP